MWLGCHTAHPRKPAPYEANLKTQLVAMVPPLGRPNYGHGPQDPAQYESHLAETLSLGMTPPLEVHP